MAFSHQKGESDSNGQACLIQGNSESSPVRWVCVQEVPGDPLASVDEPPTTSTVESKLIQMLWPICHQIVINLFFSCCARRLGEYQRAPKRVSCAGLWAKVFALISS